MSFSCHFFYNTCYFFTYIGVRFFQNFVFGQKNGVFILFFGENSQFLKSLFFNIVFSYYIDNLIKRCYNIKNHPGGGG